MCRIKASSSANKNPRNLQRFIKTSLDQRSQSKTNRRLVFGLTQSLFVLDATFNSTCRTTSTHLKN